jgi:hypothetical protein
MTCNRRWQAVKLRFEFGVKQLTFNAADLERLPSMLLEETHQGLAREKTQVRVIQQALGPVTELALDQLRKQAAVAHIRYRGDQLPSRLEQGCALRKQVLRRFQVLKNVSADDGVITLRGEEVGQRDGV